ERPGRPCRYRVLSRGGGHVPVGTVQGPVGPTRAGRGSQSDSRRGAPGRGGRRGRTGGVLAVPSGRACLHRVLRRRVRVRRPRGSARSGRQISGARGAQQGGQRRAVGLPPRGAGSSREAWSYRGGTCGPVGVGGPTPCVGPARAVPGGGVGTRGRCRTGTAGRGRLAGGWAVTGGGAVARAADGRGRGSVRGLRAGRRGRPEVHSVGL